MSERRSDLPGAFGRLIARCLEKDRDRRIQTARDVRNEIDVIRRGSFGRARCHLRRCGCNRPCHRHPGGVPP